jgi:hypothetical protein
MAAHPTLDQVAVSRGDGKIALLHVPSLTQIGSMDTGLKGAEINAMTWTSETHLLFATDTKFRLLDSTRSKVERTFDGHQGSVIHMECYSVNTSTATNSSTRQHNVNATHVFTMCDRNEVVCWNLATGKVISRTSARGPQSSLFLLDDRNSKSFTHQLLPILVDPEGITVITTKNDTIGFTDPDLSKDISVIISSTPVLLI